MDYSNIKEPLIVQEKIINFFEFCYIRDLTVGCYLEGYICLYAHGRDWLNNKGENF